jgi:hypothetical protein
MPAVSAPREGGEEGAMRARPDVDVSDPHANPAARVRAAALRWPGVQAHPHRFGSTEFRLGRRELGHVHDAGHGAPVVDVPFPRRTRDEVLASGAAERHHLLPDTGWVSVWLWRAEDVERAVALLGRSYDLALAQAAARTQREAPARATDGRRTGQNAGEPR